MIRRSVNITPKILSDVELHAVFNKAVRSLCAAFMRRFCTVGCWFCTGFAPFCTGFALVLC